MIIIHHGSGVEQGLAEALEGKNLVKPPYETLKTDQVRELVEVYSKIWPIKNPALVAGPLDEANPSTLDILLKRIEEPLEGSPELFLWARDYGTVPDTIRSRCGEVYHYQPVGQHILYQTAEDMVEALRENNLVSVSDILRSIEGSQSRIFLDAYVEVLLNKGFYNMYDERLQRILKRKRVSSVALYGYFLGGLSCQ